MRGTNDPVVIQRAMTEELIKHNLNARRCIRIALTRLFQRANTQAELDDITELLTARLELKKQWKELQSYHPNRELNGPQDRSHTHTPDVGNCGNCTGD